MENDKSDMYLAGGEQPVSKDSNMASASQVLGILTVVTFCCCWVSVILGALGITFALLSRVDAELEKKAKMGLILSVIGMVLGIVAWVVFFVLQIAFAYSLPSAPILPDLENLLTIGIRFPMGGAG